MSKTYSVVFNHDTKLSYKKGNQKIKPFWEYFMLNNQAIWSTKRTLGPKLKTQPVKLLEMTVQFAASISNPYAKISINSVLTYCRFIIWKLFSVCPHEPENTHTNGLN